MAKIPFPYDEEQFRLLKDRIVYYEGQRGCPYGCTYCLSSIDRTLRHKPLNKVKDELRKFMEAGIPLVKFVDRTFNVREDWAYEVLAFILKEREENGFFTSFHLEIGAATLSERIISLFNASPEGLFQIEAGIQSTDRNVLERIRRQDDPDRIRESLEKITRGGRVHVHTDLIAGLPGDTLDTFRQSFNECITMEPGMLQVGFLKVLKGTPLDLDRARYGILHRSWPPYEVLETDTMSYEDLQLIKEIETVTDRFYNSGKFTASMKYLLSLSQDPWDLFKRIAKIMSEHQKDRVPVKFELYYSMLKDLMMEHKEADRRIMTDLLRFDWIRVNRSGYIPDKLQHEKYYSQRTRLSYGTNEKHLLKGSVSGFNMDVLRFFYQGEVHSGQHMVFYSPQSEELIPVLYNTKGKYEPVIMNNWK